MPTSSLSERRFIGRELIDDPYPFYAQLRRDAPVWRVPGTDAYLVAEWDTIAEAAGRVEDFSNHFRHLLYTRDDGTLGVLDQIDSQQLDVFSGADPPDHTVHRKFFASGLSPRRIELLEADVAQLVGGLLDRMLSSPQPDAASELVDPLPAQVIADLIGFADAEPAQLHAWVSAGSRIMGGRLHLEEMAGVGASVAEMPTWVRAQLDGAMTTDGRSDVLGLTAAGVREGTLSDDEAVMALMIFVGAGVETTTGLIGNSIRVLAEQPELQHRLRSEPSLVPPFVEEVLRLESPFQFHPRMAVGGTVLGGVDIPDGALVLLLWASGNRDQRVFDDAAQLCLERPATPAHFGFGRGIHHCVGAPLARLESRIALTQLLVRTREFSLVLEDPPIRSDNLWIRRQERLPLAIERA